MMCEAYASENKQKIKEESLKDKLIKHFKEDISKEIDEFVDNTVLQDSRYLFIRTEINKFKDPLTGKSEKVKRYFAYCTHCKEEYEIDYSNLENYKHNKHTECEKCKTRALVKHSRYGRKHMQDRALFLTYEKSKIDKETLVARGFFVYRDYAGDYKRVVTIYREISRYIFTPGYSKMFIPYYGWYHDNVIEWEQVDKNYSWTNQYGNYKKFVDKDSILRAVKNTRFERFPYKEYLDRINYSNLYGTPDMTDFFYTCNKYPIIEQLYKADFKIIADYMIKGYSMERTVKWKRTNIFEFLGINKGQAKEIKASKIECTPMFLKIYKRNIKDKSKFTLREINRIIHAEMYGALEDFLKISEYSNMKKTLKYIKKQQKNKLKPSKYHTVGTYKDYLQGCMKLNRDMKDSHVLFPKNIFKAHDNTFKLIEVSKNKLLDKKIKERCKTLKKYEYKNEKYLLRAIRSSEEMIEEGKKLDHCVATYYMEPYANKKTNIFAVRDIEKADEPLVTVEIKAGDIKQAYGIHDTKPRKEVLEFLEEYKEKVLKKLNKNKKAA